ncbi:E3 ubiquitin-protein ligase TM129 isoform X2 [Apis mellifera]|uniref:E3 ubiquitin-protein ligase TM129 isoform X2 n=1 Tax=Apis mellifera TaxID=7460 RepID=A0A7M7GL32_APIME|nr:E3 ubiquitin-protein ligase TM129 isoform X2 [Apis mellifera]|eukprot:XP_006558383.1 E3 ubiquitin-protein ligase TM129 isoform X2 [Apis mellifera]
MSAFFFYTLFYTLMSGCIIYPPTEFVSAGLTIKDIFSNWLGSENEFFVQYHIKRSIITLFIHSMLPFGYAFGLVLFGHVDVVSALLDHVNLWSIFVTCSILMPLYTLYKILIWSINNWSKHPIAQNLAIYCNNNNNNRMSWTTVASDINVEYQRIDKTIITTNSITSIIATDNWIIKVLPYKIMVAHQNDTALIVNKSDTHEMSPLTRGEVQFINIEVKPTRPGSQPFDIRLNVFDFKNLQDKVSRPIIILQNITFHKTLLDKFIDNFKEQVQENPYYEYTEELGQCIGCMQALSNIKLNKQCSSGIGSGNLEDCMVCIKTR